MLRRIILLIVIFYFLALFQSSLFPYFGILGFVANLTLLSVILINIFIHDTYFGLFSAVIGGFFWDVFSSQFFGYHVLILLLIASLIQIILKKYVRTSLV
jgi:rod shape-determining protein MreD